MKNRYKRFAALLLTTIILFSFCSCGKTAKEISAESGFSSFAKASIDDFIKMYGKDSSDYKGNAYVCSDFDNTAAIFDITYQCNIHQLRTMSFALSPTELKETLSVGIKSDKAELNLIDDIYSAYTNLYNNYGPFTAAGLDDEASKHVCEDKWWAEFSTKMIALLHYIEDNYDDEIAFAWILYWYSGMTEDEVYSLFKNSCEKYANYNSELLHWVSPSDIKSKSGVKEVELILGVSVTNEVRDMYKRMNDAGIDVWICSASHSDGVRAAVDAYGLSDCIKGVIGMTQAMQSGKYISAYDYETGYAWDNKGNGIWEKSEYAIKAMPAKEGKVTAIVNSLVPVYNCGPIAGFMDSSGDFNFCTEFDSLKMVICYNRASPMTACPRKRRLPKAAGLWV